MTMLFVFSWNVPYTLYGPQIRPHNDVNSVQQTNGMREKFYHIVVLYLCYLLLRNHSLQHLMILTCSIQCNRLGWKKIVPPLKK